MPIIEQRAEISTLPEQFNPALSSVEISKTRTSEENAHIFTLRSLLAQYQPREELPPIDLAINKALDAHYGQKRISGGPYSMHLLIPTIWAAELGLKANIITSLLLHDADEDTSYKLADIKHDFGGKIARIDRAVTKFRGPQGEENTAFKLLEALVHDPEAVIVRGLEQEHNSQTLGVLNPAGIDNNWKRTVEVTAPLIWTFGMRNVAKRMIYNSTQARFPDETNRIIEFINTTGIYEGNALDKTRQTIARTINPSNGNHTSMEVDYPTLYDLLIATKKGESLQNEGMVLNCDIGYEKDEGEAAAIYTRLRKDFGYPLVKSPENSFALTAPTKDPVEEIIAHGKLEFYQMVNGRLVRFRLIPKEQFNFERISLLPLFQEYPDTDKEGYDNAIDKLASWQTSWKRWKRSQAKNLAIKEFILFLQGEGSAIVHTPATEYSRKGHTFEMPIGSTGYDLIAGLPLSREKREKLLLYAQSVKISKGEITRTIHPDEPLPSGWKAKIITAEKPSLSLDIFDHIVTEKALRDIRRLYRRLMRSDREIDSHVREWGRVLFTKMFFKECRIAGISETELIEVPLEKDVIGVKGVADFFKNHEDVMEKSGKDYLDSLVDAFYKDIALHAAPDHIVRAVVEPLVKYRKSLIPIAITTFNGTGLDAQISEIFARNSISFIGRTTSYPQTDQATLTTFIDPKDRDKMATVMAELARYKETRDTDFINNPT